MFGIKLASAASENVIYLRIAHCLFNNLAPFVLGSAVVDIDELLGDSAHNWRAAGHCVNLISLVFIHDAVNWANYASRASSEHFKKLK